jgi:protein O-GlcNAc transferase
LQNPQFAELYYNLGTIVQARGAVDEAQMLYRQSLALKPELSEAYNNLGNILKDQGQFDDAIQVYQHAIRFKPDFAEAYNNFGSVLELQGQWSKASIAYQQALLAKPDFGQAYLNLAALHWRLDDRQAALETLQRAIYLMPNYAEAHCELGHVLHRMGQIEEAVECYEKAIRLNPRLVTSLHYVGNAYQQLGRLQDAIRVYEHIIREFPSYVAAYCDLASTYQTLFQFEAAEKFYLRAIEIDPKYVWSYANLAGCYMLQGKHELSMAMIRRALAIKPDIHQAKMSLVNQMQQLCDWSDVERLSQELIATVAADRESHDIAPFSFIGLPIPTTAESQLKCGRAWGRMFSGGRNQLFQQRSSNSLHEPDRRLRIGYLSADFRVHAVAYMLPELFEAHDRQQFSVYAYAICGNDQSPIRQRLMKGVDAFRELQAASHRAAAEQILLDEIDILIDLQGYTTHCRTEIIALRPAPIQVSYIGYPGTMGWDFMDYILADDYVLPLDQQAYFTEKIVHLPGCYQVNDRGHEISDEKVTRRDCGLPEDGFVFCSFNNNYKFTLELFAVWMRLLKCVPGSVLWLAEKKSIASENLRQEASRHGVDPNRLVFAKQLPIANHLVRQPLADLFLDTFPYNAHATASIALRMGVPIVTLSGSTMASRVAGSLLRAVGLSNLITKTVDEYEALALHLATHRSELEALRKELVEQVKVGPLFDGQQFARNVEKAYREMWRRFCLGMTPEPFAVTNEPLSS